MGSAVDHNMKFAINLKAIYTHFGVKNCHGYSDDIFAVLRRRREGGVPLYSAEAPAGRSHIMHDFVFSDVLLNLCAPWTY